MEVDDRGAVFAEEVEEGAAGLEAEVVGTSGEWAAEEAEEEGVGSVGEMWRDFLGLDLRGLRISGDAGSRIVPSSEEPATVAADGEDKSAYVVSGTALCCTAADEAETTTAVGWGVTVGSKRVVVEGDAATEVGATDTTEVGPVDDDIAVASGAPGG